MTSLDTFSELPARIEAVSADDVARAARTYLLRSNRTVGWFDPLS